MIHRLLAIPVAIALAACSTGVTGESSGGVPRVISVRTTDALEFEPAEISVTAGETVRFEVTNDGQSVHEFLIGDEAAQARFEEEMASGEMHHEGDVGVTVDPGESESFEFTFGAPGELLAGCHEPGHYEAGMVATIEVTGS